MCRISLLPKTDKLWNTFQPNFNCLPLKPGQTNWPSIYDATHSLATAFGHEARSLHLGVIYVPLRVFKQRNCIEACVLKRTVTLNK